MSFATCRIMTPMLRLSCGAVGALATVCLAGCVRPVAWSDPADHPAPDSANPPVRSLALDAPALRAAKARAGLLPPPAHLQWYEVRQDFPLATDAGYSAPAWEREATYTYDRQSASGGFVRDFYSSHTYRLRLRESVR